MNIKKLTILAVVTVASLLVRATGARAAEWHVPGDFATIQAAINSPSVTDGDRIVVGLGSHAGALVTKAVEIKGEEGATITSGPVHGSGQIQGFRLLDGSSGSTISHLRFTVDLAIMNAAGRSPIGPGASDVTISHSTFVNPVQAISNWGGSGWNISHNEIIDLRTNKGGGIGILVADYLGRPIADNVVAHNKITGTLHVKPGDGGGYSGTGIVLYADFRWGSAGASEIAWNRVVKNKVSLTSDNPNVVDVVAFELTDTRELLGVIHDNAIGFNDFRGTADQIALTPSGLDNPVNNISRNLGENRGHGLHPSLFGPGGN